MRDGGEMGTSEDPSSVDVCHLMTMLVNVPYLLGFRYDTFLPHGGGINHSISHSSSSSSTTLGNIARV